MGKKIWHRLGVLQPPVFVRVSRDSRCIMHRHHGLSRITPASPPPASPPFRQGRRCDKSVPVDPRSAVPLPDTPPPPPLTEAWPELRGQRRDLASTSVHMLQVQAGQPAPKRRKKYNNIDSHLHQLGLDYMICHRTMESYMEAVGHMMNVECNMHTLL